MFDFLGEENGNELISFDMVFVQIYDENYSI